MNAHLLGDVNLRRGTLANSIVFSTHTHPPRSLAAVIPPSLDLNTTKSSKEDGKKAWDKHVIRALCIIIITTYMTSFNCYLHYSYFFALLDDL
jgi:hypothetical protein